MKKQFIANKRAEVEFRTRLQEGAYVSREPSGNELLSELTKRVEKARIIFRAHEQETSFSPFLEIGAERGQRSMLLASEFRAQGFMLDLSLDSLREAEALRRPLKLNKIPQSVVADAYNLPFPNNSFAFIIAFQTIHHFPDPEPILREVNRVLAPGGVFILDEEPIRQIFNVRLWRRPTILRWWEKILKATILLHFLSEIGKSETDAGIIETSFSLPTWEKALNVFETAKAALTVFPFGPTETISKTGQEKWLNPSLPTRILLKLLGGNIQAICTKSPNKRRSYKLQAKHLLPPFVCPSCPPHPLLEQRLGSWYCLTCKNTYPVKDGIPILIERTLRQTLYPNA